MLFSKNCNAWFSPVPRTGYIARKRFEIIIIKGLFYVKCGECGKKYTHMLYYKNSDVYVRLLVYVIQTKLKYEPLLYPGNPGGVLFCILKFSYHLPLMSQ